jgi:lysophospholipase L1-like esterase
MTRSTVSSPTPRLVRFGGRIARVLIGVLIGVGLALLLLEGLLSLDPLGLRYIRDYKVLSDALIPAPAGYTYAPGVYTLSRSVVTMRADGTRLVPASAPDDTPAPLAFIGDSVTFGLGVSDDHTFTNLIASALPGTRVINAGLPAFNIVNIRRSLDTLPADARVVYLITANDSDPIFEPDFSPEGRLPDLPWVLLYWLFLPPVLQAANDPAFGNAGADMALYQREVAQIAADPRVLLIAGYDDRLTPATPGAVRIPRYTTRISFADEHPDASGHRELAAALLAILPPLE